jgi:hypothetical protein
MNTQRPDVDRALRHWFEDGPTLMPDRVVDGIEARIARQPQRRTWRLQGRPFMSSYAKLAAGMAAVLIVGFMGWQLLPRNSGVGGPEPTTLATPVPTVATPSPTLATPSPTLAPFPCQEGSSCAGVLAQGAHASALFSPRFTFTTNGTWANSLDKSNLYELDSSGTDYLLLWSDVAISQHTGTCEAAKMPGVGNKVQDWIDFATTHPGMTATNLHAYELHGVRGQVVDLKVTPGWTKGCPNFSWKSVQFIMNAHGPSGTYGAAEGTRLRLYVLDVRGDTVLVEHYGSATAPDDIVSTMEFATAP